MEENRPEIQPYQVEMGDGTAPPPIYESAINAPTADMPPSYDSLTLINKLKKAKEESANPVEYLNNVCTICCGSFLITIIFAVSIALPITMIIIGAMYQEECNVQKYIPIWLIVSGAFGCLSSTLRTAMNCYSLFIKRTHEQQNSKLNKKSCLVSLIETFLFAWFIAGNVWVYSVKDRVSYDSKNVLNYCNETVYLFSFWLITLSWVLTVVVCCCCCCVLFVAGFGMGVAQLTSNK